MGTIRPIGRLAGALAAGVVVVSCAPSAAERRREAPPPPPPVEEPRHSAPADPVLSWPGIFADSEDFGPDGQIAMEFAGMAVSQAEYGAGLEEFRAANPDLVDPLAEWNARVREQLLTLAWLRRRIVTDPDLPADGARSVLRDRLAEAVVAAETRAAAEPTEEEVLARYERDRADYAQEPRVAISMILVPTEQEAETANRRLAAGESFATVASEMSTHSSRATGGEIEPFVRGTYNSALEDLAFSLEPRQRGTVATPRGVFVVEKIAEIRGSVTPLEQVRGRIESELRREKAQAARRAFLERIAGELGLPAAP